MKPPRTIPAPTSARNPNLDALEPLWSIVDAAEYLGISPKTIEKRRNDGSFAAAIVIGRSVRFEPLDVRAWALGLKEKAKVAA